MAEAVRTQAVTAAILAHLATTAPDLLVFDADVGHVPSDPDGRPRAYAVVWPLPGVGDQTRLTTQLAGTTWQAQITCAGGDRARAQWAVDQVRDALTGRTVTVPGHTTGRVQEESTGQPLTEDRAVQPTRWHTALILACYVSRPTT